MRTKILLLCLFFSTIYLSTNAQSCTSCTDSSKSITNNNNNTFTAASAQAYYWEICSGNATIIGSNTSKTVTVNCSGKGNKIRLIRFQNGNCYESCKIFSCGIGTPGGTTCSGNIRSIWCSSYNGTGGYNTMINSNANTTNPFSNTASVTVKWNPNYFNGLQLAGGNYLLSAGESRIIPSQFAINASNNSPSGFYVPMIIKYKDLTTGEECTVNLNPLVSGDCSGAPMRTQQPKIKIHPNPNNSGHKINFNGVDLKSIKSIEVFNNRGENVTKINKPNSKSINSKKLDKGLYFIKFNLKNETITKKLIIE